MHRYPDPVKGADEVVAFAEGVRRRSRGRHGGGGKGMKVAHTIDEIPELYESGGARATAAFGRGECRYLDKPRTSGTGDHDQHGNVVVAGARDYFFEAPPQKLVEEGARTVDRLSTQKRSTTPAKRFEGPLPRRRHRRIPGRSGRRFRSRRSRAPSVKYRGNRGHRLGAAAIPDRQWQHPRITPARARHQFGSTARTRGRNSYRRPGR